MLKRAIEHFLFLVNLYGVPSKIAKKELDKYFEESHNITDLKEFNKWYYENYPEYNRAKDTYKGDK